MGRLFWKIFLWFWLTMILMTLGIAWGMAQFFQQERALSTRPLAKFSLLQVTAVTAILEHSGESAAKVLLQEIADNSRLQIFVVDERGDELLGRTITERSLNTKHNRQAGSRGLSRPASQRTAISPTGHHYQVMARLPGMHRPLAPLQRGVPFGLMRPFHQDPRLFSIRLGIAVLLSGLVCFWLAWYLTNPVRRLREANRRLSEGELGVRVGKAMGRRRDEIADLGRDFDRMAERLQTLILTHKQLLSDVSHELRSPLARLQVALGLARKKTGKQAERDLDRIEQEANRLDDLVGQVLTLARLEVLEPDVLEDYIDITEMLKTIIEAAEFEAASSNRHVQLTSKTSCIVKANAELLRRALENIIRNAVHYTEEDTIVEVNIQDSIEQKGWISLSVCDHGTGVPNEKLSLLFEPFVRLSEARDRSSGGYGLGLAIAERAIRLHGGQISACNRDGGGLCVFVQLPLKN